MGITAHTRGHKIVYINEEWVYADNKEKADYDRKCLKCRNNPTAEGHDFCLGEIKNVTSACCGHGITTPYIIKNKGGLNGRKRH